MALSLTFAVSACKDGSAGKGDTTAPPVGNDDETTPAPPKDPTPAPPKRGEFLETCTSDADCDSGLCIDNLKGDLVCSIRCEQTADCSDPDYRCAIYDNTGQDVVRACVPTPPTYCLPCEHPDGTPDPSVCQGYGSHCVYLGEDGYACGRDCSAADSPCPPDSECAPFFIDGEEVHQCVPTNYICSGCVDKDGDGYGLGDFCPFEGVDCNDNNSQIHPGAEERCDNIDWDCDGDPHNGFDLQNDADHCGDCSISCHRANMTGACSQGQCLVGACDPGYYDLDDSFENGCEYHCAYEDLGIIDIPDDQGFDTNCDGIDGDINQAVFVSILGSDENTGTLTSPLRTIQRGINLASDMGRTQVLVTTGNFNGTVSMLDGISVYGGYTTNFAGRDLYSAGTHIRVSTPIAVTVPTITQPTALSGLAVHGAMAPPEQSSMAILVENAGQEDFRLEYVLVQAGEGGQGTSGSSGTSGEPGITGSGASGAGGATGGAGFCSNAGGDGGTGRNCNRGRSSDGSSGAGNGAGSGGGAGWNYCPDCSLLWHNPHVGASGGNGTPGTPGTSGQLATAATLSKGSFNGTTFEGAHGGDGTSGTHGAGGGGGGSGGAAKAHPAGCGPGRAGGGGGGGGSGGCLGTHGTGGTAGGASFGVVVNAGTILVVGTTITQGEGGRGGNGGNGGDGGTGGTGGVGNTPDSVNSTEGRSGAGGKGGDGGHGGAGSGGAGACGGPSIGIALLGTAEISTPEEEPIFMGGIAGAGGNGGTGGRIGNTTNRAPSGPAGCDGLVSNIERY